MLLEAADSQKSAARFVGKNRWTPDSLPKNQNHNQLDLILHDTKFLTMIFDLRKNAKFWKRRNLI